MKGGNSPPPKLGEDNIFSEGDSRTQCRPIYKTKEEANNWGWGETNSVAEETTLSDIFEEISEGGFDPNIKRKRFENTVKWEGRVIYKDAKKEEEAVEDTIKSGEEKSDLSKIKNTNRSAFNLL